MEEAEVMKLKDNKVQIKMDITASSPDFILIKTYEEPQPCEDNLSIKNSELLNDDCNSINKMEEISSKNKKNIFF
jgi:hypothetical protein